MKNVYIASFFNTRERLFPYRDKLNSLGFNVISTWLDETNEPGVPIDLSESKWKETAYKDIDEISKSHVFILDTLDMTPRGGRECEHGFAIAYYTSLPTGFQENTRIYRVGPVRSIFHHLVHKSFESWDDLISYVETEKQQAA